jgi:hypothetical protein
MEEQTGGVPRLRFLDLRTEQSQISLKCYIDIPMLFLRIISHGRLEDILGFWAW